MYDEQIASLAPVLEREIVTYGPERLQELVGKPPSFNEDMSKLTILGHEVARFNAADLLFSVALGKGKTEVVDRLAEFLSLGS